MATKSTVTSPFRSKGSPWPPRDWVLVGNPESKRVLAFRQALARAGDFPLALVPYLGLLQGETSLSSLLGPGVLVRFESPGQNFEVEKALLIRGRQVMEADAPSRIEPEQVEKLILDRGRIWHPRQWFFGFRDLLYQMDRALRSHPEAQVMNAPGEIALMFDKPAFHRRLVEGGVPVPRRLAPVRSFDELLDRMRQEHCPRVFVKLAYGSSASGAVAYRTNGRRHQALTTVETVRRDGQLHLYNSRKIRCYNSLPEIAELINTLCREDVQVEEWIPKAALGGKVFDLRMVMIGGKVCHGVVRLGSGPMTNLHLLNQRAPLGPLQEKMGPNGWDALCDTCRRAAALFPGSLYSGLDVLVASGFRRHAVLEANAFGDWLPGVLWQGLDTYSAEIAAVLGRWPA